MINSFNFLPLILSYSGWYRSFVMDNAFFPYCRRCCIFHFLSLPVNFFSTTEASLSIACNRQSADHFDYCSRSNWQNLANYTRRRLYPSRTRKRREDKRTRAGRVCFSLLIKCICHILEYFITEQSAVKLLLLLFYN